MVQEEEEDPKSILIIDDDMFMDALDEFPTSFDPISKPDLGKFSFNIKDKKQKLNHRKKHLTNDVTCLNSSVITTTQDDDQSVGNAINDSSSSSFLFILAGLIIKAIAFQTTLLVTFLSFPIWFTYSCYLFVIDPFSIMRRAKCYTIRNISSFLRLCLGNVKWLVYGWFRRNEATWRVFVRLGWGFLCSAFVAFILFSLLVFAVGVSGAMMKWIVDGPVRRIQPLHFDYTRDTPMAFVPIMSCHEDFCLECGGNSEFGNVAQSRVIPLGHKLLATVSLTVPESDHNTNLGIFQVRVDFLSHNGKSLASTTQPCMLQFKSQPIRLLMTILKLAPLITGYLSESQTLGIKFKGYTEKGIPTSCVRVVLEPRAEFAKVGGIPEIYKAYLKLESQLPLLKRILWSWKATVFVWTSIVIFIVGLVFMLLCCAPFIVPWLQPRAGPLNNNG